MKKAMRQDERRIGDAPLRYRLRPKHLFQRENLPRRVRRYLMHAVPSVCKQEYQREEFPV